MNEAVSHLPKVILTAEEIEKTRNGIKYKFENSSIGNDQAIRMTDENDELAAIGFFNSAEKLIQPKVVLV